MGSNDVSLVGHSGSNGVTLVGLSGPNGFLLRDIWARMTYRLWVIVGRRIAIENSGSNYFVPSSSIVLTFSIDAYPVCSYDIYFLN